MVASLVSYVAYKEASRDPIFRVDQARTPFFDLSEKIMAVAPSKYVFSESKNASDQGSPIVVEKENMNVSRYIQSFEDKSKIHFFIVPGFIPPFSSAMKMNETMRKRLNWVVKQMNEHEPSVVLTTGGNVKPKGTPYNEALEMKKRLMRFHGIGEHRVAIDPYAHNTVTNLRNAGRFMLSHDIKEATVVTTYVQNTYIGYPSWTLFHWRSESMLGYRVGELKFIDDRQTFFKPSEKVFQKGPSKVDP